MQYAILFWVAFLPAQEGGIRQARELIEKLGSDRIEERKAAACEIRKMGSLSVPELQMAARDRDREKAARATELLEWIEWDGLTPDPFKRRWPNLVSELAVSTRRRDLMGCDVLIPPAAVPRLILDPQAVVEMTGLKLARGGGHGSSSARRPFSRAHFAAALEALKRWPSHPCDDSCAMEHYSWIEFLCAVLRKNVEGRYADALRELVRSPSKEVRLVAATILIALGERPEGTLLELLDDDAWYREWVVDELGRLRSAPAFDKIVSLLSGDDDRLWDSAASALVQISDSRAFPALKAAFGRSKKVSRSLLAALIALGRAEASSVLWERLRALNAPEDVLIGGLLQLGHEKVVDEIMEALDKGWKTRQDYPRQSLNGFRDGPEAPRIRDPRRIRRILEARSKDDPCAKLAEELLELVQTEDLKPVALAVLNETRDPRLEEHALRALRWRGPLDRTTLEEWAHRAIKENRGRITLQAAQLLADRPRPEPAVVESVIAEKTDYHFLVLFGSAENTQRLLELADQPPPSARLSSIFQALWRHGGEKGRARIREELRSATPERRHAAIEAVRWEDAEVARRTLENWFDDPQQAVEGWEIWLYVSLLKADAVPRLEKLWGRGISVEARERLIHYLSIYGAKNKVIPLLRSICEEDSGAGDAALRVLLEWGDENAEAALARRRLSPYGPDWILEEEMKRKSDRCLALAQELFQEVSADARMRGLRIMTRLGKCGDSGALIKAVRLDEWRVQREAVRTIRTAKVREAIPILQETLKDRFMDVVLACETALALEDLGERSWRPEVEALLGIRGLDWRASMVLDFVENRSVYGARHMEDSGGHPIQVGPRPRSGSVADYLTEKTGMQVQVTPSARPFVGGQIPPHTEMTPQGLVEIINEENGPCVACYWSGDRAVLCTAEEAVARRNMKR